MNRAFNSLNKLRSSDINSPKSAVQYVHKDLKISKYLSYYFNLKWYQYLSKMGFEKAIVSAGTGPRPTAGRQVTVHCTGYGKDGDLTKKFWSTKDTNEPFSFVIGLGQVIKGWDEGVMTMVRKITDSISIIFTTTWIINFEMFIFYLVVFVFVFVLLSLSWYDPVLPISPQQQGEVARITCTPDYAYGAGGFPAWGIRPNSTLIFEIEVLRV